MVLCQLTVLGGFQLESADSRPITISAKKGKALLAYLALHPNKIHPRESLSALLWEECSFSQARQSLRQTLSALRKTIPDADKLINGDQQSVFLRKESLDVDALKFDRLANQQGKAALRHALDLYRGELLEGLYTRSQSFDDWLESERSHRREQVLHILDVLLEQAQSERKLEQVIRLGIRITALDPLRESAHRSLMDAYSKKGRRGAALKQYRCCQQLLRNELDVAPEQETQALFHAVRRDQKPPLRKLEFTDAAEKEPLRGGPENSRTSGDVSQLRQVTLLIVQIIIAEAVEDPESQYNRHQRLSSALNACVGHFRATSIEMQNGRLAVLFGVPAAHSSDTEKAVRAAFSMLNKLSDAERESSKRQIKMGISSGQVYIPDVNYISPQPQTVSGAALHQATMLAELAQPGEILISNRAYATVTGIVTAEEISAKDSIDHKAIWRLRAIGDKNRSPDNRLVGRQFEVQQFLAAARNCKDVECGLLILVRGEAGIGKTRLLKECLMLARDLEFDCHSVAIFDFGTAIGQDPFQTLVRSLLKIEIDRPLADIKIRILEFASSARLPEEQLDFLYDLLNVPELLSNQGLYLAMDNEARRAGKQEVITTLVRNSAKNQPLLIIVEDIHWGEPVLLTMLGQLAAGIRDYPVILAFSTRLEGEPLDPVWRSRIQSTSLLTLDIPPLRQNEAVEFVGDTLALPADKTEGLIRRAGGNPLFLEQLLFCAQQGIETIPDSVQSIIAAKLDTLDSFDKRAAFAASILGQRFSQEALNYMLDDPGYQCSELVARGLIKPDGAQFLFHHALIMDGIYATQLASQRRSLHLLAANWFKDKDPVLYSEHLDKAENEDAARAYLAAVEHLMNLYQYDGAEKMARRGREIAKESDVLFDLSIRHADCLRELGQTQTSLDAFIAAGQQATSSKQQCRALIGQGHALRVLDRHKEVLRLTQKAETLAECTQDIDVLASLYYLRGNACFFLGPIEDCLAAHEQAESLAATHDLPLIQAHALSGIGDAEYGMGRLITAEKRYRRCVALCKEHGFVREATANQAMIGVVLGYLSRYQDAEEMLLETLELARKVRNRRSEAMATGELAGLYIQTDERESVRLYADRSLRLAERLGSNRMHCDALLYLGTVDKDEILLEKAYKMAVTNPFGQYYITSWILAVMAWVTVDPNKRSGFLREGERLLSEKALSHNQLMFYRYAIEACLVSSDHGKARHFMTALKHYTAAEPLPWSNFIISRAECLIRCAQGEIGKALEDGLKSLLEQADQAGFLEPKGEMLAALKQIQSSRRMHNSIY